MYIVAVWYGHEPETIRYIKRSDDSLIPVCYDCATHFELDYAIQVAKLFFSAGPIPQVDIVRVDDVTDMEVSDGS